MREVGRRRSAKRVEALSDDEEEGFVDWCSSFRIALVVIVMNLWVLLGGLSWRDFLEAEDKWRLLRIVTAPLIVLDLNQQCLWTNVQKWWFFLCTLSLYIAHFVVGWSLLNIFPSKTHRPSGNNKRERAETELPSDFATQGCQLCCLSFSSCCNLV